MIARAGGGWRVLAAVPVAALLVLTAAAVVGATSASASRWLQPDGAHESSAFWTPARMRAAKPLELKRPRLGGKPAAGHALRGHPHRIAAEPASSLASEFGSDFEQVADAAAPEFRVHGALFFVLGPFGFGRCSGTAVASGNKSVVITAAHCINSGFSDRWLPGDAVFVPAYRFGQRPFGVFPGRWMDTTKRWRGTGSPNFDVAAIVVGPNQRGERLVEAVGGAGIAWNLKAKQVFDVHGYPAEEPFDGETQRLCNDTAYLGHDPFSFTSPGPLNLAVTCGVTGGASGGAWTIGENTVNSVVSYGYFDEGSPVYGPYFGKEVARLFGRAERVR